MIAPTRSSWLAQAGTYLTTKGCPPQDDPRRPALHGLSLGGNSLTVVTKVMRALKEAGYTERERRTYFNIATLGSRDRLLAVTHQWCSLTGGSYALPANEEGEEVEVFICGLCGHEERSAHGTMSECMGCGFCHDCCGCEE